MPRPTTLDPFFPSQQRRFPRLPFPQPQCNRQSALRPQRTQAIRPFHQHDSVQCVLPIQFGQRIGPIQAPQIVVEHRTDFRVVNLHQRKRRAGHLHCRIVRRRAQKRPGKGGLPGAQRPLQQDAIARMRNGGQSPGQRFGRGEVGQRNDQRVRHRSNLNPLWSRTQQFGFLDHAAHATASR